MDFKDFQLEFESRQETIKVLGIYPGEPEMSEYESAFLTGLIKEKRPKKIVEIGVASGYTSSIILNQLNKNNEEFQMFSLDLNELFYRDRREKTGFFVNKVLKELNINPEKHTLLTGKYAVQYAEVIGSGIDFLILDTVHSLPGEVYDFLAFLPLLEIGAVVVLHDTNLHHLYPAKELPSSSYSNCALISVVVGKKFNPILDNNSFNFSLDNRAKSNFSFTRTPSNIGAIIINLDTHKYVQNIFQLLMINWAYIPEVNEFNIYRKHLSEYYSNDLLSLFEAAYNTNKSNFELRTHKILKFKPKSFLGLYLIPIRFIIILKVLVNSMISEGYKTTLKRIIRKISKHA